jgi:hypothetical protein
MTEKLASCLCEITRGGVHLIPDELRMSGTAKEICAAVDFDHAVPWTWTQDNRPQNLSPMLRADHREKTRKRDIKEISRVRRGLKKRAGKKRRSRPMQYTAMKATHKRPFGATKAVRR